ncbi:hypothetical protein ABMA27_017017 [Loxostege sticticalis]|uniref:4-nitrophenylphosphatase n=1 Tax=Loxostege sticticalis TaxID=481309 RepID=A0ABR3GYR9_LOXSC
MTTARSLTSLTKSELRNFVDSFDVVLSDCDGVLWREADVIIGSPDSVDRFKKIGKKFFYITNNNGKTREELVEKCRGLGFSATKEEIVCTCYIAAMYLKEKNFKKKVYIVGGDGIAKELDAVGISHSGVGPDLMKGEVTDVIENFKPDPEVGAVIVGFDTEFSYPKLVKASTYAADSESVILGKPETYISEYVIRTYGLDPARTLMIGDNDVVFKTLLVLSGITTKDDIAELRERTKPEDKQIVPDFYTDQLSDVFRLLSD